MNIQTAKDVMTRAEMTLSPEAKIYSAMKSLLKHRLVGAPVTDSGGRLVGMLTDKDCFAAVAGEAFDGVPEGCVEDYMTCDVETVSPTASLYEIIDKFRQTTHRKFPVVDDQGRVVGQLSRRDALRAIEGIRDNSYLYGTKEESPVDVQGVDSAMRRARDQR